MDSMHLTFSHNVRLYLSANPLEDGLYGVVTTVLILCNSQNLLKSMFVNYSSTLSVCRQQAFSFPHIFVCQHYHGSNHDFQPVVTPHYHPQWLVGYDEIYPFF